MKCDCCSRASPRLVVAWLVCACFCRPALSQAHKLQYYPRRKHTHRESLAPRIKSCTCTALENYNLGRRSWPQESLCTLARTRTSDVAHRSSMWDLRTFKIPSIPLAHNQHETHSPSPSLAFYGIHKLVLAYEPISRNAISSNAIHDTKLAH
jgi:hypothetical protein